MTYIFLFSVADPIRKFSKDMSISFPVPISPIQVIQARTSPNRIFAGQSAVPRTLRRRIPRRLVTQTWDSPMNSNASSASLMSTGSSVTAGGVWAPRSNATSTNSSNSLNSGDHDRTSNYNMDIDFD